MRLIKIVSLLIAVFVSAVPISASAKSWAGCTFIDVMNGNTWGPSMRSVENYKSWFPNSFSFNEKTLNWKGKKVDFYRSINGKFSAFFGYSTGLVPARIHIETNDKLRLRISWTEYRDTKWINFKCRTDPKTVSQSSSANSTAKPGRCTLSTPKNCVDVQVCYMSTSRGPNYKRVWSHSIGKKPDTRQMYREAVRRGLSCNVGQNSLEALTVNNVRSRGSYQKRCSITSSQIKIAQKHLKELGLYLYKIDGVAGTGTLAAIKKAKEMIGAGVSLGECLTATDIKAFDKLAATKSGRCTLSTPKNCTDVNVCYMSTLRGPNFRRVWAHSISKQPDTRQMYREAERRGLSCNVGQNFREPLTVASVRSLGSYQERCSMMSLQIKIAQKHLNEIGLYPYKIDGVAGKETLAAIKKAKEMIGAEASFGECLTATDIKAFDKLAARTRCRSEKLGQCSDEMVCERATVLRSGIRSWNLDEIAYVNRAKELSLDCKITIDNTPFSKEEAVYYLSKLVDFVSENTSDFDLKFASEFNKVRPITQGDWSDTLSKDFEQFRLYVDKFPAFQKYLEELRLADIAADQKRIEQLRGSLSQDMAILREWAQTNVLDAKAAEIAALDANLGDKSLQDTNALEQLVAEAQRLLSATGIRDGPVQQLTQEVVDGLYNPSSVYLFVNTSGDAANVYKNLEGAFTFEQNSGTYCPTEKLGAFDYYLLRDRIFEVFEGLSSVDQDCSQIADIFVVKGNELTKDRVFNLMPLIGLTQVSEFSKADRDRAYDQLTFLKEAIQKDVLDGTRVGFGILKAGEAASKICAIIDGNEYGHREQLDQHTLLMNALNIQWTAFEKVTSSSEEAFKFLQRGQCDAIYAGSLNLGRLYLAGEVADVSLEFLPIWISKADVEASQEAYDARIAASAQANAETEQNLEDQAKLDEQAQQSAAELAAVRQRKLREQNGLRFMVLRDELQAQVFAASDFGFENPSQEAGYIKRYLAQPFVDQTTRYSPFDGIIGDMQTLAAERWEITEQRLDQIDYGEASFNGRSVDALHVELKIASKNRLVGKYSEYCRRIHALKDEDFEMWRKILVSDCSNQAATSQWKLENAFESKWIVEPN